jgi:hypothetical protein
MHVIVFVTNSCYITINILLIVPQFSLFKQVNSQLISNVCTDALSAEKVIVTQYSMKTPVVHLVHFD